jgi:hypothetical protein
MAITGLTFLILSIHSTVYSKSSIAIPVLIKLGLMSPALFSSATLPLCEKCPSFVASATLPTLEFNRLSTEQYNKCIIILLLGFSVGFVTAGAVCYFGSSAFENFTDPVCYLSGLLVSYKWTKILCSQLHWA